jgi:hypothetical protein
VRDRQDRIDPDVAIAGWLKPVALSRELHAGRRAQGVEKMLSQYLLKATSTLAAACFLVVWTTAWAWSIGQSDRHFAATIRGLLSSIW